MSGDESALQHSEHGRSEFRDTVDDAAGIGKKGEDGCVCDAYSVHFQAELSGLSDGGLRELGVSECRKRFSDCGTLFARVLSLKYI